MFLNHYHHLDCPVQPGIEWVDTWDCACNDQCPACGTKDIEPYASEETDGEVSRVPHIIKGDSGGPNGKWQEVQAVQHEPFIFIQSNGSHWAGEEPDDVAALLETLAKYRLLSYFAGDKCYSKDPCHGVENPEWTHGASVPKWIDGPRMYSCDGVYRFFGNFENVSHVFTIDTNHKPTIDALLAAIEKNAAVVEVSRA